MCRVGLAVVPNDCTIGRHSYLVLTSRQSCGPLADTARFDMSGQLILTGSFSARVQADQLMQFELPGEGLVANRIIVTNTTPDPPGIDNLGTMTFDNAGVASIAAFLAGPPPRLMPPVPEPSTSALTGLGALAPFSVGYRRRARPGLAARAV